MSAQRQGVALGFASYFLWGLFPLYWPLLQPASALEILAHRIVWSLALVLLLVTFTVGFHWLRTLGTRRLLLLSTAACLISLNWVTYIWAVNHHHVIETSLGYFINPLVTVMLGVFVLQERLRLAQQIALGFAVTAVAVLTVAYGRPPWIAFALALSFGLYALIKKQVGVGSVQSLFFETSVLFLPALFYLIFLHQKGEAVFTHGARAKDVFLVGGGLVTVIPLLCFGAAANRVPLTTLGLMQYIAPVMQLSLGLFVFHEEMTAPRWVGFLLVWVALLLLSVDAIGHYRSLRRRRLSLGEAMASGVTNRKPGV